MANRVTEEEVKAIIDVDTAITDISPFMTAANLLVTNVCTSTSLSDDLLKEIERWLAAHFIAIRDVRSDSEGVGNVKIKYQYKVDLNLAQTQYGQQAMMLDISGALIRLNKGKRNTAFDFVGVTYT